MIGNFQNEAELEPIRVSLEPDFNCLSLNAASQRSGPLLRRFSFTDKAVCCLEWWMIGVLRKTFLKRSFLSQWL